MSGLIPEFTQADINKKIDAFYQKQQIKIFKTLSYVGINSVNFAKSHKPLGNKDHPVPGGGFSDRTGNLRSSIGYTVAFDGNIRGQKYKAKKGGQDGVEQGKKLADELVKKFNHGWVLIITAGMEYAAAVESKRYDVITGSSFYAEYSLLPKLKSLIKTVNL